MTFQLMNATTLLYRLNGEISPKAASSNIEGHSGESSEDGRWMEQIRNFVQK
jgi:hypothetical protein